MKINIFTFIETLPDDYDIRTVQIGLLYCVFLLCGNSITTLINPKT